MALRWGRGESDPTLMKMALTTLNQQQRLLDPVWSGFYRYAKQPDWSEPHYEKMLDIQALNISSYLEAYQVTETRGSKRLGGVQNISLPYKKERAPYPLKFSMPIVNS